MQRNRPVPGITRGPQQFSPSNLPPIPSPMPRLERMANQPPPQVPPPEVVAFQEQLQDMAMEIYCRMVADAGTAADPEFLRQLANHSRTAARAYFESMGVTFQS